MTSNSFRQDGKRLSFWKAACNLFSCLWNSRRPIKFNAWEFQPTFLAARYPDNGEWGVAYRSHLFTQRQKPHSVSSFDVQFDYTDVTETIPLPVGNDSTLFKVSFPTAQSQSYGTAQRTNFSRSTWTRPQGILEGLATKTCRMQILLCCPLLIFVQYSSPSAIFRYSKISVSEHI